MLALRVILYVIPNALGVSASRMSGIPHRGSATVHVVGDVVFYAVVLSVIVGLWFFRRWARILYLVILSLFVLALLTRPQPVFASTTFLAFLIPQHVIDGVVITMTYLGTVGARFTQKA
jgi:hypothetical protein